MASLQTSIQLQDRMSAVINRITGSMNMMINVFETAQHSMDHTANAEAWDATRQSVMDASIAMAEYREELARAAAVNMPGKSMMPQGGMSAADRMAAQFQTADQMAQKLARTQQTISAQARNVNITPPKMLNDITKAENNIQSLINHIQELNRIPINLRTEQTSNEMESIIRQITQATQAQDTLSQAVARMDFDAANMATRQLDTNVGGIQKSIQDNITAQEQFNQSLRNGGGAASALESKLKSAAMSAAAAFSAQKVLALADTYTQTTARLNLMNYGLDTTAQLQEKIFASAQRSRAPYQATADAISKMGMQARRAFSTNDEIIAFTEQLNKNFVIAGTSAQGIQSVMLQLTQSMAAGRLQGEELNAVLDNAQPIVQHIQDYLQNVKNIDASNIKKLAADGVITAQIIKDAMFYAADETNRKFASMPMTFQQVGNAIKDTLLQTFQPVIQLIGQGATQISDSWSTLEPIFYGFATGILIVASAWGIYTVATWLAFETNKIMLATMIVNPWLAVAFVIGYVATIIYKWVQVMGGARMAWQICVDFVLTQAARLQISFYTACMNVCNYADSLVYGFEAAKVGVVNALGNMKAQGLMILQNFVNGAINMINQLITSVNSITGAAIPTISWVADFGSKAVMDEAVKQGERAANLAEMRDNNTAKQKDRQTFVDSMERQNAAAEMQRRADLAKMKNDAAKQAAANDAAAQFAASDVGAGLGNIGNNTGNTAGNTARMADTMDMAEEDLKSMRDMAEQEIINRFTTAELTVNMGGITNQVNSQMDLDGIGQYLDDVIFETLETAAEGVHV